MKKYDSYKDSGIEWIGEIPSHWEIKKLNWCFELIGSGTTPKADNLLYYLDGNTNWLLTGDLNDGEIFDTSKKITQKAIDDHSTLKVYPTESIVMAMYGATIGKLGVLKIETTVNQACCVLSKPLHLNYKFAFYILLSARTEIINMSYGGGQPNISQELIKSFRVQIPPIEEQTAIASFLDLKTSEIDEIIADKKRLLELYEEEKTAIINQAVTKGLDPNVPMKDSGIEWLGEIPEHWEAVKFNHYVFLRHGYQFRDYDFTPTGLKIIKITQLKPNGDLEVNDVSFIDENRLDEFKNILIEDGDILMALTGGTIGKIVRTPVINEPLFQNYRVGNFFPVNERLSKDYLFWVLSSEMILKQIFYDQRETGQPNIGKEDFGRMIICLPNTIKEQEKIVEFIKSEIKRIDFKKARTEELIELLTEYRTALISEAVTGKIKVTED